MKLHIIVDAIYDSANVPWDSLYKLFSGAGECRIVKVDEGRPEDPWADAKPVAQVEEPKAPPVAFTLPSGVYKVTAQNPTTLDWEQIGTVTIPSDRKFLYDVHTVSMRDMQGNPIELDYSIADGVENGISIVSKTPVTMKDRKGIEFSTADIGEETTYVIEKI